MERLTLEQMQSIYPNTWLGIKNIKYQDNGTTIKSAEVIYSNKTASELGEIALKSKEIQPLFTTPDNTHELGFIQF